MVPQTNFTIQGTNTNSLTAAIAIQSGSLAIGDPYEGGVIACLNGGLNNLIAATDDYNIVGIKWGPSGTAIGAGAQSPTDGATIPKL